MHAHVLEPIVSHEHGIDPERLSQLDLAVLND